MRKERESNKYDHDGIVSDVERRFLTSKGGRLAWSSGRRRSRKRGATAVTGSCWPISYDCAKLLHEPLPTPATQNHRIPSYAKMIRLYHGKTMRHSSFELRRMPLVVAGGSRRQPSAPPARSRGTSGAPA